MAAPREPDSERILIVDDHEDNIELLRARLEAWKYRTECAMDGAEALRMIEASPPDLILLDVMMPIMDGKTFRVQQQIDPSLNQIPVVVLSAHADAKAAAAEMKADGFLKKPIDLGTLLATVDRFCARDA